MAFFVFLASLLCLVCLGSASFAVMGNLGFGGFWTFMFLFSTLCLLGGCAFLAYSQLCTRFGSLWCASCWTRPWSVLQWEHYLCDLWRANMAAHTAATHFFSFFIFRFKAFFFGFGSHIC